MKKETTIITLASMTEEQKAMLSEEQMSIVKSMTDSNVSEKIVSSTIKSMIREAEKAQKLQLKAIENENKKALRAAEREAKHAEKYLSFHTSNEDLEIVDERNDLKGMVIVKSAKFGLEVVIPSGHDNNAVVVLRQIDDSGKYDIAFDTKQKRCARTANLVHNNKALVSDWIKEAVARFETIYELVDFLQNQVNTKGEQRYSTLDLDLLNEAQKAGDKASARLAKKYGEYFTMKGLK